MEWKFEKGRIYSVENDVLMAETTYEFIDNMTVDINSTFVSPTLRGKGVAGKMLEVVAEHLRNQGLLAIASCPFAEKWLEKNKERFSDIIFRDKK